MIRSYFNLPRQVPWCPVSSFQRSGDCPMSLFEIKCPLCKGTLWIDQSTGKVVDHTSADHQKTDFGDFMKKQKEKSSLWEDKFKKAAEDTAKRKAEIGRAHV